MDCQDCINKKVMPLFQPATMHLHLPMTISAVREHISQQQHLPPERRHLGFLSPAGVAAGAGGGAAAGAAAGPIGAAVGAAVGLISSLFGGAAQRGRDEEASGVALQQSVDGIYALKASVQRGEMTVDQAREVFKSQILNQFLIFISTLKTESVRKSRSTKQKRDLENLFEKEVGSLTSAFLPGRTTSGTGSQQLPGYCPGGTYHPIEDPLSCVPYPTSAADLAAQAVLQAQQEAQRQEQQARKAQESRQRALQKALQQAAMPCPSGQQRNPATGQCVQTGCPPGTYRDPSGQCVILPQCVDSLVDIETGQCVEPAAEGGFGSVPSWLWLLLLALVLASSAGGGDERVYYRRGR